MSNNSELIEISVAEYTALISRALLLEELIKFGVEEWEHFEAAVESLHISLNEFEEDDDEMQG